MLVVELQKYTNIFFHVIFQVSVHRGKNTLSLRQDRGQGCGSPNLHLNILTQNTEVWKVGYSGDGVFLLPN